MPIAFAATAGVVSLLAWADAKRKSEKPVIQLPSSPAAAAFHQGVLDRCQSIHEEYKCVPGLTNGHVETIFAAKLRRSPKVEYARECLIMADKGCVALDWDHEAQGLPEDAPIVILMPGLTGGSGDSYILHAVVHARELGIRAVVCNGRGTAQSPVTTPQYYSASYTGDIREVVAHIQRTYPRSTLLACGWSLGANILIKYLAEEGQASPLSAAVSMCNPFDLSISDANFQVGFNRIYDWNLAAALRRIMGDHGALWNRAKGKFKPKVAQAARTIREFDDAITIHSFGWESTDQYYAASSSSKAVPQVAIPMLCLQALDDPIAPKEAIPYEALRENPNCVLATTPCGGHLGWVSGKGGPLEAPWSNEVMMQWLVSVMQSQKEGQGMMGGIAGAEAKLEEVGAKR